jgi:2-keto-3-deoxy-L-rhamnonate aldolase RhmA
MDVVSNHTKRRLAAGGLALGMGVRQSRTVDIAAVARGCDFDWLFIDMEHSSTNLDTAAQIAMAALAVGITPLVRVPGPEHHHASRILDSLALQISARRAPLDRRAAAAARLSPGSGGRGDAAGQRGDAGRGDAGDTRGHRES